MGINPKATDSLETRRIRIKIRLNTFTPYTFRAFMRMLKSLANGEPFEVYLDPGTYLMRFILQWGGNGKVESLKWLIDEILPENIAIESKNEIPCVAEGFVRLAGGACFVSTFFLTNDGMEDHTISGVGVIGGGTVPCICRREPPKGSGGMLPLPNLALKPGTLPLPVPPSP